MRQNPKGNGMVKNKNQLKPLAVLVMIHLLIIGSGCVHLTASPDPKHTLRQRVSAAWQARVNGDWDLIYDIAASNYKKHVTRKQHLRQSHQFIEKFNIADLQIFPDERRAKATVQFDIRSMGFLIPNAQIQENWVLEKGVWFLDLPVSKGSPFDSHK
ncbi:MAG: hypothetical protein SRB2_00407 [Desulfobacteraceae bacterium Eth-SRB2]|nr:MAG: hypothetical protein SRB2_00407 [Desulfobacteraceae bacterium Eth-SRB2]